jgi:hypothetical protein
VVEVTRAAWDVTGDIEQTKDAFYAAFVLKHHDNLQADTTEVYTEGGLPTCGMTSGSALPLTSGKTKRSGLGKSCARSSIARLDRSGGFFIQWTTRTVLLANWRLTILIFLLFLSPPPRRDREE